MQNYKKMYFSLFSAVTDALKKLEGQNYGDAANLLKQAQISSEELYISTKDEE